MTTAALVALVVPFAAVVVTVVIAMSKLLGARIDDAVRRIDRGEDAAAERHAQITTALSDIRTDLAVIRTELTEHGRRLDRVEP